MYAEAEPQAPAIHVRRAASGRVAPSRRRWVTAREAGWPDDGAHLHAAAPGCGILLERGERSAATIGEDRTVRRAAPCAVLRAAVSDG